MATEDGQRAARALAVAESALERGARSVRRGWTGYFLAGAVAAHLTLYAGALFAGLALRDAGVPVPFTIASLCYVIGLGGLALLLAPRLAAGYARYVTGGRW